MTYLFKQDIFKGFLSWCFFILALLVVCSILIYMPIIALIGMLILSVLFNANFKLYIILYSLLFASLACVLNLNDTYYADIARYYADFYRLQPDYSILINSGKIFRWFMFSIIEYFNFSPTLYSGISVFFIFINLSFSGVFWINKHGLSMLTRSNKIVFLFCLLSLMPSNLFLGFEMILSISFFFNFITLMEMKKTKYAILFLIMSIAVHVSAFYFVAIYILVVSLYNLTQASKVYSLFIPICIMFLIFNYKISIGLYWLDFLLAKAYNYYNGYWSNFNTIHDKFGFLYVCIRLIFVSGLIFLIIKQRKILLIEYFFFVLCFSFVFLFERTLSFRLFFMPVIMLFPYIYVALNKSKMFKLKQIRPLVFSFCIISIFSWNNLLYIRFVYNNMYFGSDGSLILSLYDLFHYQPKMAADTLIYQSLGNF